MYEKIPRYYLDKEKGAGGKQRYALKININQKIDYLPKMHPRAGMRTLDHACMSQNDKDNNAEKI